MDLIKTDKNCTITEDDIADLFSNLDDMVEFQRRFLIEMEQAKNNFKNEILKSELEMQEHTLEAISMEIHDNVSQVLSVSKLTGRILNLCDSLFALALSQKDSCCRCMRENVSTNRFASICTPKAHRSRVTLHLVCLL